MSKIKISERDFSTQVEDLLKLFGWRFCHFRPARTASGWRTAMIGSKGFPDYIATRPPRLLIFELKSEKGKVSPEQEAWLADLRECVKMITFVPIVKGQLPGGKEDLSLFPSIEVYLWRPNNFIEILRAMK